MAKHADDYNVISPDHGANDTQYVTRLVRNVISEQGSTSCTREQEEEEKKTKH